MPALRIDPCAPKAWTGFRTERRFRGAWYDVQVRNPLPVRRGIRTITLDERPIGARVLPLPRESERHRALVELGGTV